jgi:hypothetical protein
LFLRHQKTTFFALTMKPALGSVLLMVIAVVLLLGCEPPTRPPDRAGQLAFKAKRVELVDKIRLSLASASEAEKSAVMAVTDADSQTYANQARAAAATVEQTRNELADLLKTCSQNERDLLAKFSQAFAEFQRIDKELLDLAVENSNLKASSLTFGPAAAALNEMDAALARLATTNAADAKIVRLADDARIAALHIQTLLPPHIAAASNAEMDKLEATMAKEDREVRQSLQALATMPALSNNTDLMTAASNYDHYSEIKAQILKLSRENANVRSVAISLNQKRNVMFQCQDALAALENAIQQEPVAGVPAPISQNGNGLLREAAALFAM